jgi:hypothetical protein
MTAFAETGVGYRVKSRRGTQFGIWAARTLREHLSAGVPMKSKRPRRLRQGQLPTENPQSQGYRSAPVTPRQSSLWLLSRHQSSHDVAMTPHQPTPSARGRALFRTAHP